MGVLGRGAPKAGYEAAWGVCQACIHRYTLLSSGKGNCGGGNFDLVRGPRDFAKQGHSTLTGGCRRRYLQAGTILNSKRGVFVLQRKLIQ
jgi:hypothetical protein